VRWTGHAALKGEIRNAYRVLVRESEARNRVGSYVDWIYLVQNRDHWQALVSMVMNIWFQKKVRNFLTS